MLISHYSVCMNFWLSCHKAGTNTTKHMKKAERREDELTLPVLVCHFSQSVCSDLLALHNHIYCRDISRWNSETYLYFCLS